MSRRTYRENSRGSGGRRQSQGRSHGDHRDVEATRNQSGTSAIISIPNHTDIDNDSVSVLSDPSAAWVSAAANSIVGMLGRSHQPPTGANGGADEEYDYYCQGQQWHSKEQQPVQYSWRDNDIEQPHRQRHQQQHETGERAVWNQSEITPCRRRPQGSSRARA